jgi:sterol desaturase/sphingolipid hydroxylase (fatty acid hydroxylase superfamily)
VLLGFSPKGIIIIVPYIAFYVMFLHSNISWDFGLFRWVLVSPAYHRWHHTSDKEGIDKNFAGIFPIWDLLFGTAHFPHALPARYGVKGKRLPKTLRGQLVYPFWKEHYKRPGSPTEADSTIESIPSVAHS